MQDLIVGAGAVGLGIGTALLAAGRDVAFVARGDVREHLRADGVSRSGLFGEWAFGRERFRVVESIAACRESPQTIVVAVKSTESERVAREIADCPVLARAAAPIVLFQNGLGNAEHFAAHHPKQRIFNAVVITGFHRRRPTHAEITAHAAPIRIGSLWTDDVAPVEALATAIDAGGIPCVTAPRLERDLWAKLLYNAGLNPLGALIGVPYGTLAARPETRHILDAVMTEVFDVMRAEGAETHWPDADAYRSHFYAELIPPTAAHESSMLQDIRAGRRTEIDALAGEIVRRGQARGVPTPVSEALARLVRAQEGAPCA
jgi:2-dehydropantoate 2-reductase